jgi:SAM-dependent methyltransferase
MAGEEMQEHTGVSYKGKAGKYAAVVDDKPWNALYERPAVLSMLPPLAKIRVLDAGCGSGWYASYLLDQGAQVTAVDYDDEFVALTRERLGTRARILQADLSRPLEFAADAEFDLIVSPLVMHYFKDWEPVLKEYNRILKPHGLLVFSTHHPFMDWKNFNCEDYFRIEKLDDEWKDIGKIQFYRRPLTAMSSALFATGFLIERLLEPQPVEAMRQALPDAYDKLMKTPWFLVIRARKAD